MTSIIGFRTLSGLIVVLSLGSWSPAVGDPPEQSEDRAAAPGLYPEYLAANANGKAATLPDYSFAGYHRSEKSPPRVTKT